MEDVIRAGIGVIITRDKQILLGERIGAHGANTWALPGGHLEVGETIESCAKREVFEETGLEIAAIKNFDFSNDIFEMEGKHYVTLFVSAKCQYGDPELKEPDKCVQWRWFRPSDLPTPLFLPLINLLQSRPSLLNTCDNN